MTLQNEYSLIETPNLVEWAADLAEAHALRAYDAVQLAAALEVNANMKSAGASTITLVSADGALNTAAITQGLAVDDPNTHP
jgi:predicted nucleic acid-binding protein